MLQLIKIKLLILIIASRTFISIISENFVAHHHNRHLQIQVYSIRLSHKVRDLRHAAQFGGKDVVASSSWPRVLLPPSSVFSSGFHFVCKKTTTIWSWFLPLVWCLVWSRIRGRWVRTLWRSTTCCRNVDNLVHEARRDWCHVLLTNREERNLTQSLNRKMRNT